MTPLMIDSKWVEEESERSPTPAPACPAAKDIEPQGEAGQQNPNTPPPADERPTWLRVKRRHDEPIVDKAAGEQQAAEVGGQDRRRFVGTAH